MQKYVEACARRDGAERLGGILDAIIAVPGLHARFVNTLSRVEYVGIRKMLKSRRSDALELDGLQHMLDEMVHALRLKKAAAALGAQAGARVDTYADGDTLAGDAGEAYLQALDAAAAAALADVPAEPERAHANYLLTSAAVEVRAQAFYPAYEQRLRAHGAPFSVSAITRDEDRHLTEMSAGLARAFGGEETWRGRLEPLLVLEETLFGRFLDAVETAVRAGARPPRTAAVAAAAVAR